MSCCCTTSILAPAQTETALGMISIRTVLQALYFVPSTVANPNPFYQVPLAQITHIEDAQNLLFSFFATGGLGITLPTFTAFDPNALGQYTLGLRAIPVDGTAGIAGVPLAAIQVNVGAVPEPGTLTLLGLGLLAGARRMSRKKK